MEDNREAIFLTLTYSNEYLPLGNTLRKDHLQRFFKRLRNEYKGKIKYYACGEYGELNKRPHYHAIIFGVNSDYEELIKECWGQGFIVIGTVTQKSINYVTDYINKKLYGDLAKIKYENREVPFNLMSKGLGLEWIEKYENENQILINIGIRKEGKILRIPRYFVKKMKTEIPVELWNDLKLKRAQERDDRRRNEGWSEDELIWNRGDQEMINAKVLKDNIESKMRMKSKGVL